MTTDRIAVTEEDHLRHEIGRLQFVNGHLQIALQDFKEQHEADEFNQEEFYSTVLLLLEWVQSRK